MASSNSPERTNEFVFTTKTNLFVRFLGEFEDTKKSFRNYLTFSKLVQAQLCLLCAWMPHHSWFLLKQGLKRTEIFMRLQYCFGRIVIDTNGSWCLSLKPCFSKRDETSVRSVNRVGEIYVGERETKGNQSFRKMFALQTTSTSLRLLSKTPEDERRKTSLNSSQQLSSPQWSKIEHSIWKLYV